MLFYTELSDIVCIVESMAMAEASSTCVIDPSARADTVMSPQHYSDNLLGWDDATVRQELDVVFVTYAFQTRHLLQQAGPSWRAKPCAETI